MIDTYIYPLLINGERFYLNKDPFIYAEEGVSKYWPEKVEEMAHRLDAEDMHYGREASTFEQLLHRAARKLAINFLVDDDFIKYFKQDGYDLRQDYIEEYCLT